MTTAYYNENDPFAAQWLRNLIDAGHIAPGEVDERSILDVRPDDLAGFAQCHFFAGIGVWSHALRLAGWPDDRPVWTGSCPCQPFSVAGMGRGVDDERHLWPFWFHLIEQRRPAVVLGEQVDAAARHGWLDLVQSDMETIGYAFASVGIPAAAVRAPHIRQRLWFVAYANKNGRKPGNGIQPVRAEHYAEHGGATGRVGYHHSKGLERLGRGHQAEVRRQDSVRSATAAGEPCGVADNERVRRERRQVPAEPAGQDAAKRGEGVRHAERGCEHHILANAGGEPRQQDPRSPSGYETPDGSARRNQLESDDKHRRSGNGENGVADPDNSFWRDADWLFCRDGKWRPVEPGTFPLAHGSAARVGRLRAYGNAIVPQVAAEVIAAFMAYRP